MKVECKGPQRTVISAFNQRFKSRSEKIRPKKRAIRRKKIGRGRLIIQAVSAYGRLLDTEELEERVTELEEKLKDGVLIPNGKQKKT